MEDINHGLMEYLKVFFRRKWLIIVPAFSGLVLGICLSILLPKQYLSSTKIMVQDEKTENPLLGNLAISTTVAQRIQTIKETMLSWDFIEELVARLKLARNARTELQKDHVIENIQKKVIFTPIGANVIEISYTAPSAAEAQAVVHNITDIFIQNNLTAQDRETSEAIKFIEDQLHVYRGKIKSSEIAALKDKLNALLVDSTEMHPMVKQLRVQIDQAMKELKAENLEYTEDAKLTPETTNPMITQIQQALANIGQKAISPVADKNPDVNEKDLYKVMLIDKLDDVMARDANVNENIYNTLLQHLETAKITQRLQASKEGTKYTIIEQPRVPLKPVSPNKVVVSIIGLLLGLGAGAVLIFVIELLDTSFLDVNEARNFLGTPLLGYISKINTIETVKLHNQRQISLLFWMSVAGILMVSFTVMISNYKNFNINF